MAIDIQYHGLSTSDELAIDEDTKVYIRPPVRLQRPYNTSFLIAKFPLPRQAIASTFLYLLTGLLLLACAKIPTDQQCTHKMSTWSPMLDAVEYEWVTWDFSDHNKYTGKPNQETENEWDRLWQYGSLGIPDTKLYLLNKSVNHNWLYTPAELGGGVTAMFEGFHQIHCLNLVRQYTYRDQYDYGGLPAFDGSPAMLLNHVEHCIEMLRVDLMCFSDDTPYLIKIEDNGAEVVDASSLHRCRKFEKLIDWAENHIVEPYNATLEIMKHADKHYEKNSSAFER